MANRWAYIRVSTKEQNEARQVDDCLKLGIPKENIIIEKISGRIFNRKRYSKLIRQLKSNDELTLHSIDRLGRDYDEILSQWNNLTVKKKITIKVIDTPLLNTDTHLVSLMDKFIRDVTLLTYALHAEQEWHNIRKRQAGGIESAKKSGKHLGRPKSTKKVTDHEMAILIAWKHGEMTASEAMKTLSLKRTTFYDKASSIDWDSLEIRK